MPMSQEFKDHLKRLQEIAKRFEGNEGFQRHTAMFKDCGLTEITMSEGISRMLAEVDVLVGEEETAKADGALLQALCDNVEADNHGYWLPEWCILEHQAKNTPPTVDDLRDAIRHEAEFKL